MIHLCDLLRALGHKLNLTQALTHTCGSLTITSPDRISRQTLGPFFFTPKYASFLPVRILVIWIYLSTVAVILRPTLTWP